MDEHWPENYDEYQCSRLLYNVNNASRINSRLSALFRRRFCDCSRNRLDLRISVSDAPISGRIRCSTRLFALLAGKQTHGYFKPGCQAQQTRVRRPMRNNSR